VKPELEQVQGQLESFETLLQHVQAQLEQAKGQLLRGIGNRREVYR